jgi:hypothetical protein
MALLIRDYKYEKGKELLESLKGEQGDMIRHYVSENEKVAQKLRDQINEMQEVFNGIKKYIR